MKMQRRWMIYMNRMKPFVGTTEEDRIRKETSRRLLEFCEHQPNDDVYDRRGRGHDTV